MTTEEIFSLTGDTAIITELKAKRGIPLPDKVKYIEEIEPMRHKVFDTTYRPDKKVKIDPNEYGESESDTNTNSGFKFEPVARIALAIQKLIVKRAVSFIFGNSVGLNADPDGDNQTTVLKAVKRVLYDIKDKSLNRKVARELFTFKEVAELWYPVPKDNAVYGFNSKFKLRCAVFSPAYGDTLYPYFDDTGDMIAFSREFEITDKNNTTTRYFETYTDQFHYMWSGGGADYTPVDGYPKKIEIGKIPVIFGSQKHTEWADVQILIDRLEKLLSNFADTNDYHASPKIFIKGNLVGFAKKGESGAILQGDENSSAEYLSWANAPESVKLEIDTLLRMIYTITQTPDISFDAMKSIGAVATTTMKLMFMDAHLKVADHQEVFDEYLQRRINVIKAYIGKFNTALENDAELLQIEPVITPYIIKDEAAELKIWTDANGGNPVISQKASFQKAALTGDPEADYEQYLSEETTKNTFSFNQPTQV